MVDTSLTADAVEDIINLAEEHSSSGTVLLFTGDADLIPVVEKALKYGWTVEVYSYKDSLSNQFETKKDESDGHVTIHFLDTICNHILTPPRWRHQVVATDALVLYRRPQPVLPNWPAHYWDEVWKIMAQILAAQEIAQEAYKSDSGCPSEDGEDQDPEDCPDGFRCSGGGRGCRNRHSSQELEYFARNPDLKSRLFYKTKMCCSPSGQKCEFRKNGKGYLCPFAHGTREAHCISCGETGLHWGDRCPNPKIRMID